MTTCDPLDGKNRRQRQLLDDLQQIESQMRRWAHASMERIRQEQERYDADVAERDRIVGKAIRAGLSEHPFVQSWFAERRMFGEKDVLRRFRLGFERGVVRTMPKADFYVTYYTSVFLEKDRDKDKEDRLQVEKCRRWLRQQLLYSEPEPFFDLSKKEREELADRLEKMTRQGFHKWLNKLGLIEPR